MTKAELIRALEEGRERFLDAIDGLDEGDLQKGGAVGEWSLKDLLAHLTMWEAELVKFLWQARQGVKPATIHFNNISVDEVNERWYRANQSRPLAIILDDFHGVRNQTLRRVEAFSEEELIDPKLFPWLGDTPLFEWIAGDSYQHEAEHEEQIRSWRRTGGL